MLVAAERGKEQERYLIGFIEDGETLENFGEIEGPEFVGFFSAPCFAEEELLRSGVREAPDHRARIHRKANPSRGGFAF